MFKLSQIKELAKLVDTTSIQELEIESEGSRIMIRKSNKQEAVMSAQPIQQPFSPSNPQNLTQSSDVQRTEPQHQSANQTEQTDAISAASGLHQIVSPMVGTFYRFPSPESGPFVNNGDKVSEKTVVCIVEAMKLMNEIEAEVKGEIVESLAENGQLVEYGQPLFLVRTV